MANKFVLVVVQNGSPKSTWGSLTELCKCYGFSYDYLKQKKFPIVYRDGEWEIFKLPYNRDTMKIRKAITPLKV